MDRLDGISDPDLRDALLAVRGSASALTADDLAERLGCARSTARQRLERLAAAGLVTTAFERRTGRTGPGAGRPAKTYAAAPERAPLELPARRYGGIVADLAAEVPAVKLAAAGYAYGRELASAARVRRVRRPRAAFEAAARALRALGYQAAVEEADDRHAVIVTATCPLRPLVAESDRARELDRGMWRGLVSAALGSDPHVTCETHDCLGRGACRVELSLRS